MSISPLPPAGLLAPETMVSGGGASRTKSHDHDLTPHPCMCLQNSDGCCTVKRGALRAMQSLAVLKYCKRHYFFPFQEDIQEVSGGAGGPRLGPWF